MNHQYTPDSGRWRIASYGPISRQSIRWKSSLTLDKLSGLLQLICLAFVFAFGQAKATDVYLASAAQGGSASNSGASFASPKETIAYLNTLANNNITATAGLHLYIKGNASYTWSPSGAIGIDDDFLIKGGFDPNATGTYANSANNPLLYPTSITLTGTPGGQTGVFGMPTSAPNGFTLSGINFVGPGANNYLVRNTFSGGLGIDVYTFKNCSFKNFGSPIWSQGNKIVYVDNCHFENNIFAAAAGAISMVSGGELSVINSNFVNNQGSTGGGGAITSTGRVTVTNSGFCTNKNVAPSVGGGGAYGDINANQTNKVTFTGCTFTGNNANAIGGGAIAKLGGVVEITNCQFYNNYSTPGGGAVLIALNTTGSFITGSNFYKNYSVGGGTLPGGNLGGGAVHIRPGGAPTNISNCVFDGNYIQNAGSYAGAIFLDNNYGGNTGHLNLDNCKFVNNLKQTGTTPTTVGSDIGVTYGDYGSARTDINVTNSAMQLTSASVYRAVNLNNASPYHYVFGSGNTFGNTLYGLGSPTYSCPATINAVAVNVQGQVWDDVNGNVTLDGGESGTNAGGPLYVNLVDGTGTVVGSTTVSASGSYTLTAPVNTTGLKLVLTNTATSNTPGTLPSQWVNTGESVGAGNTATQSATLGQIELSTGTGNIIAQNFGIEHLPSPGSGTATVANAGGTSPVSVPPSAFTSISPSSDNRDTPPGSVTAIRITVFPSNVTSLTINGTVYTASSPEFSGGTPAGVVVPTNGSGAPTVPILVDPTNDATSAVITFKAIDNAGKESITTGTATINSTLVTSVTGRVWNDTDGNVVLNGSETGTNAGGALYVNLVDGTGTVVGSTSVASDGSYTLTGVPTNISGYKLVLSTSSTSATAGPLPTGWVNTGESVGPGNTASQSATLGQIELTTGTGAITAQDFGIEHLPTPGSGANTVSNAGGTSPVTVPANTFTNITPANDNGDTPPGSVTAVKLTTFPTNVTSLTIDGAVYTSLPAGGITIPTDGSGNPTVPIAVDPTNDSQPVVFTYTAIDNAGKESTITGTATLNSTLTLSLSGNVFDDANGLNDTPTGIVNGTPVNGPSLPVYVSLVQSGMVVATVPVAANGTYSFSSVSPGSYSLVVTTNPAGSTSPSLPTSWSSVGEHLGAGAGSDGNPNGVLPLTLSAITTNANFGIDQLPTASPVSQTYVNPGGTNQVQVPTLTGSDPEDGALGAGNSFVIYSVPASGVLYYQGNAITAADVAGPGLVISDYDPTELTYDPIDGPGSYSFAYSSVDAAGLSSLTTTATMVFTVVPDLTPVIYARPSTVYNTTNMSVVVDVFELLGVPTSGLITVRLTKDPLLPLVFPPTASSVGGRSVQNSAWSLDSSNPSYYTLTTSSVVAAGDKLSFGLTGQLIPGATTGVLTVSSVILGGSGGEVRVNNNVDADKIDYFQQ